MTITIPTRTWIDHVLVAPNCGKSANRLSAREAFSAVDSFMSIRIALMRAFMDQTGYHLPDRQRERLDAITCVDTTSMPKVLDLIQGFRALVRDQDPTPDRIMTWIDSRAPKRGI